MLKPVLGTQLNLGHPLARGLVGCWLMNEGGGNLVADLSGNGNAGTSVDSGVTWQASRHGTALHFDGSASYVNCGTDVGIDGAREITIVTRYMLDATGSYDVIAGKYLDSTNNISINANTVSGTALSFTVADGSTNYGWTFAGAVTTGKLYQISCVFNGYGNGNTERAKIYIDDVNLSLNYTGIIPSAAPSLTSTNFNIGNTSDTFCFNGLMYYMYVFNRALTPNDIQSLYMDPYQMLRHDPIELWAAAAASAVTDTGIVILRRRRECA